MSKRYSSLKNHSGLIVTGLLLVLLVSACGNNTTLQPIIPQTGVTAAPALNVQTPGSGPQVSFALPTGSPVPTSTPTTAALPSDTPTATPTQIPATPTPQSTSSSIYYSCSNSAFIKDMTIPDGTVLTPGETFTKTWKLENTGSCIWTSNYSLVFVSGTSMGGSDTQIGQTVYVGKRGDISVALTAPEEVGTYTGYWQMADQYGYTFGATVYVQIVVENEIATSTPAAPGKAVLFAPSGSLTANLPTYTWSEVSGAAYYLLQVNGPSGNVIQTWYSTDQASCNGTTCSVTPATALSSGVQTWWVQTWSSAGYGPASDGTTFTVSAPATPTATWTPTPTALPTLTETPVPTSTSQPTSTPSVPTNTPAATATSVPTLTNTPVPTSTAQPTSTPILPTNTPVPTQTSVPTATIAPQPTQAPTNAPTATAVP